MKEESFRHKQAMVTLDCGERRIYERTKLNLQSGYLGHLHCNLQSKWEEKKKKKKSEEVTTGEKGFKDFGGEAEVFAIIFFFPLKYFLTF